MNHRLFSLLTKMPRGVPRELSERLREIVDKATDHYIAINDLENKWDELKARTDEDEWAAACEDAGWSDNPNWGDLMA